jgi:hypothetical protein
LCENFERVTVTLAPLTEMPETELSWTVESIMLGVPPTTLTMPSFEDELDPPPYLTSAYSSVDAPEPDSKDSPVHCAGAESETEVNVIG